MNITEALQRYFGHAQFRPGQEALIEALLSGRDALGIMPTGGGKSICYQLPAMVLDGVTLVVSPLISLMKDQVAALVQSGVAAAYINSSLTASQTREALRRAEQGRYRIIYVAPERLHTPRFQQVASRLRIALVAVDEAHCVSQWGQDFRPDYLQIASFIDGLAVRPPVGAFTATATQRVRNDICTLLRLQSPYECVTGYDRHNLFFEVRQPKKRDDELLSLLHARRDISGIVYCATRKNVDKVCDLLRKDGHAAARYHAGLPDALRQAAQDDFQHDRAQVMVATNAFGMGIDKSNVGYVIHYNMPRNLESYYQEAGRAGRDGSRADCILLYAKQDVVLGRWMIDHAEVNPDMTAEQRAAVRESELERLKLMTWYATGRKCLRHTVLAYFGESSGKHCGNCSVCCGVSPLGMREKPVTPVSAREEPLFAALRLLRNTIAKSLKVPAYVVLTDASLRDMAVRKPHDMAAFLQVSGVGEVKCSRFGPAFLRYLSMLDGQDIAGLQLTELAQEAAALVGRGKAGTGA